MVSTRARWHLKLRYAVFDCFIKIASTCISLVMERVDLIMNQIDYIVTLAQ